MDINNLSSETLAHLRNIDEANNNNRLAIFVGAGVSKNCKVNGKPLPDWSELITDLKADLSASDETDPLKIAQLYFQEFGEHTYYQKLKCYFPDNVEPHDIHRTIFEIKPDCVVTTNWDEILEKEVLNGGHVYDVVTCDSDLVKATNKRKVIKMHGDFNHHNLVFKEDDYLRYSANFPLIENYIKSILSTHTILFVGYSYNDINLKQIIKWHQNLSDVAPPYYLFKYMREKELTKIDEINRGYLNNHGITVLYEEKHNGLNRNDLLKMILSWDEKYPLLDDESVVRYFVEKVKVFDTLDFIFYELVTQTITNCGLKYSDDGQAFLNLYQAKGVLTSDYDESQRSLNTRLVTILNSYQESLEIEERESLHDENISGQTKELIEKFLAILSKSFISGIVLGEEKNKFDVVEAPIDHEKFNEVLSFNWSESSSLGALQDSYIANQFGEYQKGYLNSVELVRKATRTKDYVLRMLAVFNANYLGKKNSFYTVYTQKTDSPEFFKPFDLEDWFYDLPKNIRYSVQSVFKVANFDFIYKLAMRQQKVLTEKEHAKTLIEQGGWLYQAEGGASRFQHKSLVSFIVGNALLHDSYPEFDAVIFSYLKTCFLRQFQAKEVELNRVELFSCIRYLDAKKELSPLFKVFLSDESERKSLKVTAADKDWVINDVLNDLSKLIVESNSHLHSFTRYFYNCVSVISVMELSSEEIENVLSVFKKTIFSSKSDIQLYDALSQFLGIQYNLFKTQVPDKLLEEIIDAVLFKFAYQKANGFDEHVAITGGLGNLFGYAKNSRLNYQNEDLVERVILEVGHKDVISQIRLAQSLLISLMHISNQELKNKIKNFISSISFREVSDSGQRLEFELLIIAEKIKAYDDLKPQITSDLKDYFSKFGKEMSFSSMLYPLRTLLKYLIENMQLNDFKDYLEKTNSLIEQYETSKNHSIF